MTYKQAVERAKELSLKIPKGFFVVFEHEELGFEVMGEDDYACWDMDENEAWCYIKGGRIEEEYREERYK